MIRKSFTLIELLVVMGVMAIIMTFGSINLLSVRNKSSLNSTVIQLVADLKQQQIKSMIADTEGRSTPDYYGIHFTPNSYTLFHGTDFASTIPTENFIVNLEQDLTLSPNQDIIFKKGCGELVLVTPITPCGSSGGTLPTITISNNNSSDHKEITINLFGVIESVN